MTDPTVCLVFKQTVVLGCDPQQLLRCLQSYSDDHLHPAWNVSCLLRVGAPDPGDWPLYFLDDADQAGDLGYHEDATGTPRGFVFVKAAAADGQPVSLVASHELAELLLDPGANRAALSPRGRFAAWEICDPVQGDTFDVAGLPVSNFVLPSWFGQPGGAPYDALGRVRRAWQVAPGGYALVTADSGGWSQVFGSTSAQEAYRRGDARLRRRSRRRPPAAACEAAAGSKDGRIVLA